MKAKIVYYDKISSHADVIINYGLLGCSMYHLGCVLTFRRNTHTFRGLKFSMTIFVYEVL
jgi:hypothetical protein